MSAIVLSDKNNYRVLGILIRSERMIKGYSLRELGELTNISHTLISNIEKGKQIPAPDTLADIFKVLDLTFYDDENLTYEMNEKSELIYNYIFNQEYELAKHHLLILEEKEDRYKNSVEVVNYILIKSFYYAIANQPCECIDNNIDHYGKLIEFFTEDQKQLFFFVKGLNFLNNEFYSKASTWFNKALRTGRQELDVFIKEYNIISLVRQYKFMDSYRYAQDVIKEFEHRTIYYRAMKTKLQVARILYHIAKNDEVEEMVGHVERFSRKFEIVELLEECIMLRAAIKIRTNKFKAANELLDQMPNQEGIATVLLRFKVAFVQNDVESMKEIYNKCTNYEEIKNHEKIYRYLTVQAMSRVEELYNKEEYLEHIEKLCEIAVKSMDQEMIGLAHNYLIMYYQDEKRYKKAMEVAEKLLHVKKIRLDNK